MFDGNAPPPGAPITKEQENQKENGEHKQDGGDDEDVQLLPENLRFFAENTVVAGVTARIRHCSR